MKQFPGILKTHKTSNKEGLIIYHHELTPSDAKHIANFDKESVKQVASYLRSLILSTNATDLPDPLTTQALGDGQGGIPTELRDFFNVLYTGSANQPETERNQRLVQSVSDDVVFAVTRGRTKPGKHLCIGLGIKSLTGRRQIIDILNRFGHSINDHTVEAIETQVATDISDRHQALPDGMSQDDDLSTCLAWNNYDENTETLSGAGTLHDTVGICYQTIPGNEGTVDEPEHTTESTEPVLGPKRHTARRSFLRKEVSLEPYRKKPKISVFQYQVRSIPRPPHMSTIEYRDLFWMMNVALNEKTPMWTGWNSLVMEDPLPRQQIGYMENINLPPTRLDVVAETLKQTQRVAMECNQPYIVVTYDLAIAKPALQIQATESPLYDNIFICFGAFHVVMAYFGGLGYLLDGSGGPEILTETEVLAAGSLNGFLPGKHYNRYSTYVKVFLSLLLL